MRLNFLLFLILILASCRGDNNQKPKIRLVNLQGKSRDVEMRTPELNNASLAQQGELSEKKIAEMKKAEEIEKNNPKNRMNSGNKYANENPNVSPDINTNRGLSDTLSMPTEELVFEQNRDTKTQFTAGVDYSEKDAVENAGQVQSQGSAVEPSIKNLDIKRKKYKFVAKTSDENIDKPMPINKKDSVNKQIFIQAGAFGDKNRANNQSLKIKKILGKKSVVNIEQDEDKKLNRIFVGPFPNSNSAEKAIKKLEASGNVAIIVKK